MVDEAKICLERSSGESATWFSIPRMGSASTSRDQSNAVPATWVNVNETVVRIVPASSSSSSPLFTISNKPTAKALRRPLQIKLVNPRDSDDWIEKILSFYARVNRPSFSMIEKLLLHSQFKYPSYIYIFIYYIVRCCDEFCNICTYICTSMYFYSHINILIRRAHRRFLSASSTSLSEDAPSYSSRPTSWGLTFLSSL